MSFDLTTALYIPLGAVAVVAAVHLVPYIQDAYGYNTGKPVPGPFLAKISNFWLGKTQADGHRSEVIHELHEQHGDFVRIAPNHVSIANPAAVSVVLGHGTGTLKSEFYDAFVSLHETIFNTRDRHAHTRKRKIVSNVFSSRSVLEFEPHVAKTIKIMVNKWDNMLFSGAKGETIKGATESKGRVWFDIVNWYNYLAFDIISDLAYGKPFGMIEAGEDVADYVVPGSTTGEIKQIPAIEILNQRGDFTASMGVLPSWMRPLIKKIPWYAQGAKAMAEVAGIAVAAVDKRLAEDTDRVDLLAMLRAGKDETGEPMGRAELTAEAMTQLVAGSDTTSNSLAAITYYIAANPKIQEKLQAELDEAFGNDDNIVPAYEEVKGLKYLEACINEGLRLHGTIATGLPRVVPETGLEICGRTFAPGSVVSVPTYTIHRNKAVWGEDADIYNPERWFTQDKTLMTKTFGAFSYGPRACVGRNVAYLEISLTFATLFKRFSFELTNPDEPLLVREGFLRKPLECNLGIRRRDD